MSVPSFTFYFSFSFPLSLSLAPSVSLSQSRSNNSSDVHATDQVCHIPAYLFCMKYIYIYKQASKYETQLNRWTRLLMPKATRIFRIVVMLHCDLRRYPCFSTDPTGLTEDKQKIDKL